MCHGYLIRFLGTMCVKSLCYNGKPSCEACCFLNNLFWILQHRVLASPAAILSLYQSDTSANSKKFYQKIEIRYSLRPVILIVFLDDWRCSHSRLRRLPCLICHCLPTIPLFFYWVHRGTTAMNSPAFSLFLFTIASLPLTVRSSVKQTEISLQVDCGSCLRL